MKRLTRYVFGQLLYGMVFVTVGLACVIWLTQSLRFVEMIVNRGLGSGTFLRLTGMLLPNYLVIILPIALFTVVIFVYSKLITDRELVVMRNAGLGQTAIARPALILATLTALALYALNLYLVPASYRMFREMQWEIRYSYAHVILQEGTFNTLSKNITVYVRERTKDSQLLGILVHDARTPEKPSTIMAERGALVENGARGGARFVVFNGNRQEMDRDTNRLSVLYFDRYTIELDDPRQAAGIRYREARERSLEELLHAENQLGINENDIGKFKVEGHRRLTSPLAALGLTLIGLASLLTGSFSRRTQTHRVLVAVSLAIMLQAGTLGLENLCARRLELVPLMYVNAALPIVAGYIVLLRSTAWRRLGRRQAAST